MTQLTSNEPLLNRPQPAEPQEPPVKNPQPYKDPVPGRAQSGTTTSEWLAPGFSDSRVKQPALARTFSTVAYARFIGPWCQ